MEKITKQTISVESFAKELELEILYSGESGEIVLETMSVSRPGLQLAGFFEYFTRERVQVFGNAEMRYYYNKPHSDKILIMDMILANNIPCSIVSRDLYISEDFINSHIKHKTPLFRSNQVTSQLVNKLVIFLNEYLAQQISMHGVLLDIYGVGVLITGNSGIGKSEAALELVKRGHRLVADDSVIIKQIQNDLVGTSPELIRYFMEIRGIGIIDVRSIYGVASILKTKKIDVVVELEIWKNDFPYDRLGENKLFEQILDISLPKLLVPITPGRNLAIILETAANNYRLKLYGYDAAQILIKRSLGEIKDL